MKLSSLFSTLLIALALAGHSSARTWTNSTGRTTEADFGGVEGDKVKLKMADGKEFTVPIASLSKLDQDYVATQPPGGPAAPVAPAAPKPAAGAPKKEEVFVPEPTAEQKALIAKRNLKWHKDMETAKAEAAELGLPIMAVFLVKGDAKSASSKLEKEVLDEKEFKAWATKKFVVVRIETDKNLIAKDEKAAVAPADDKKKKDKPEKIEKLSKAEEAIAQTLAEYNLGSMPGIVFADKDGKLMATAGGLNDGDKIDTTLLKWDEVYEKRLKKNVKR